MSQNSIYNISLKTDPGSAKLCWLFTLILVLLIHHNTSCFCSYCCKATVTLHEKYVALTQLLACLVEAVWYWLDMISHGESYACIPLDHCCVTTGFPGPCCCCCWGYMLVFSWPHAGMPSSRRSAVGFLMDDSRWLDSGDDSNTSLIFCPPVLNCLYGFALPFGYFQSCNFVFCFSILSLFQYSLKHVCKDIIAK